MKVAILLDVPDGNVDDYRFNVEVVRNVLPFSGDDVANRYRVNLKARAMPKMMDETEYEKIQDMPEVDAIPIGYIDQVIDEYEHMIEHYLYDDDEDLKEYLCYRNCLNNLKRRWKKQCER